MNIKNRNQWFSLFYDACLKGDVGALKELNHPQWIFKRASIEAAFRGACARGHLEVVKYCINYYASPKKATSKDEEMWQVLNIHGDNEMPFILAAGMGHLEVVKYLLTSPDLIQTGHSFADLHADHEAAFKMACEYGALNVIQYLLTSPQLKEAGHTWVNMHEDNEAGLQKAFRGGHKNVIQYLLTSHELKEAGHTLADVHAEHDEIFKQACQNERWNLIQWLIMDYGIEKTNHIKKIIMDKPEVQEWFKIREDREVLSKVLHLKENEEKKKSEGVGNVKNSMEFHHPMGMDERAAEKINRPAKKVKKL